MNSPLIKTIFTNALKLCCRNRNNMPLTCTKTTTRGVHVTSSKWDLMEFFDSKRNWGETNIKVGRAWKLDELRIKSNADLHKLWYILLKERNMLYTMEHECNEKYRLFPNPERVDKVQESMNNIETVVRERNVAYYRLETGETGERPVEEVVNIFGLKENYEKSEYYIPRFMNTRWVKPYLEHGWVKSRAVKNFLRLYNEKLHNQARKARNRDFSHVQHLLKRFPNMDMEKLQAEYPNVDIEKAKRTRKARGHFLPQY